MSEYIDKNFILSSTELHQRRVERIMNLFISNPGQWFRAITVSMQTDVPPDVNISIIRRLSPPHGDFLTIEEVEEPAELANTYYSHIPKVDSLTEITNPVISETP